jgi:hypothetical protein
MNGKIGKILSLSVVLLMIMISFVSMDVRGAGSHTEFVSVPLTKTIFFNALDSVDSVNTSMFKGHTLITKASGNGEDNISVSYNAANDTATVRSTKNTSGACIYVGGWIPAVNATYSWEIKLDDVAINGVYFVLSFNSIYADMNWAANGAQVTLNSHWYDTAGVLKSNSVNTAIFGAHNCPWIKMSYTFCSNYTDYVEWSSPDGSTVYASDWHNPHQNWDFNHSEQISPSVFPFTFNPGSNSVYEKNYTWGIRNLTETTTVFINDVYADTPRAKYTALACDAPDGPGINGVAKNITTILSGRDAGMTFMYDPVWEYPFATSKNYGWNLTDMINWTNMGFEVGIHERNLKAYTPTGIANIHANITHMIDLFNQTVYAGNTWAFCSLTNDYDMAYSEYVYDTWGAISRKIVFDNLFGNHGYLNYMDAGMDRQNLSDRCADRGIPTQYFTHLVGIGDSTMAGGSTTIEMTPAQFGHWVNDTYNNSVQIVGYVEYATRYSAPLHTSAVVTDTHSWEKEIVMNYDVANPRNSVEMTINLTNIGLTPSEVVELTGIGGLPVSYLRVGGDLIVNMTEGITYTLTVPSIENTGMMTELIVFAVVIVLVTGVVKKFD